MGLNILEAKYMKEYDMWVKDWHIHRGEEMKGFKDWWNRMQEQKVEKSFNTEICTTFNTCQVSQDAKINLDFRLSTLSINTIDS